MILSINPKYPTTHTPFDLCAYPFFHASSIIYPHLVVPLTLDSVSQLLPLYIAPQPKTVLSLTTPRLFPCYSSVPNFVQVDFMNPSASQSHVSLFVDINKVSSRATLSWLSLPLQWGVLDKTKKTVISLCCHWTPPHLTSTLSHVVVGLTLWLVQLFLYFSKTYEHC